MEYNQIKLSGKNEKESINGSNNIIVEIMRSMTDLASKNQLITDFKLTLMTKEVSKNDSDDYYKGDEVFVNKSTMRCLKVVCKNGGALNNFMTFLEYTYDLHINMTNDICRNFRAKFTSLYYDAFFGNHVTYIMDADEINRIFEARQFKYRLATFKDNGNLIYRLIDAGNESEVWKYPYIDPGDNANTLKTEIRTFVITFKNTYGKMDSSTYKLFASGFKNIYNSYVDDKYEKITIAQINNILKSMKLGYEVKRRSNEWTIEEI